MTDTNNLWSNWTTWNEPILSFCTGSTSGWCWTLTKAPIQCLWWRSQREEMLSVFSCLWANRDDEHKLFALFLHPSFTAVIDSRRTSTKVMAATKGFDVLTPQFVLTFSTCLNTYHPFMHRWWKGCVYVLHCTGVLGRNDLTPFNKAH